MTYNNLPPQAYTRDDVTKAYLWIQTQPASIRKQAVSKESLVALFLKAKRSGKIDDVLAPVSSKNFTKDLENLAAELNQFEKSTPKEEKPMSTTTPDPATSNAENSSNIKETVIEFQKAPVIERTLPAQENKNFSLQLDPRSEQIIRSVKAQLNMESEKDIVRMLLVLGYDRIKTIFPLK